MVASLLERMGYTDLKSYENRLAYVKIPQKNASKEKLYHVSLECNDFSENCIVEATSLRNALDVLVENFPDISYAFRSLYNPNDEEMEAEIMHEDARFLNATIWLDDEIQACIEELKIPTDKPGYSLEYHAQ